MGLAKLLQWKSSRFEVDSTTGFLEHDLSRSTAVTAATRWPRPRTSHPTFIAAWSWPDDHPRSPARSCARVQPAPLGEREGAYALGGDPWGMIGRWCCTSPGWGHDRGTMLGLDGRSASPCGRHDSSLARLPVAAAHLAEGHELHFRPYRPPRTRSPPFGSASVAAGLALSGDVIVNFIAAQLVARLGRSG